MLSAFGMLAMLGLALVVRTTAATHVASVEAESGAVAGNAAAQVSLNASGGSSVRFGSQGQNPGTATYPADIFGPLWKVTLPITKDGKVVEIKPPAIATYSDQYMKLNAAKNGVVFTVFHGGGTTSNSSNPRSELRERYDNDPEGYWSAGSGTHTMEVVTQVNRLTKVKPHVVIAQVHDGGDDVVVWRVEGTKLWLTDGNTTRAFLVDDNFKLGTKVRLKYEIKSGQFSFYYNGTKLSHTDRHTGQAYFKVGNYLQSNPSSAPGESTSEYSEVELTSVKVSHQ
jgi:hypothetical protein